MKDCSINFDVNSSLRFYKGFSMGKTFRFGDILIVQPDGFNAYKPGDIIVLQDMHTKQGQIVHRVIYHKNGYLITCGDWSRHLDPQKVYPNMVLGRVSSIIRSGVIIPVKNGTAGLLRFYLYRIERKVWNAIKKIGRPFFQVLKKSKIVNMIWHPKYRKIHLKTRLGEFIYFEKNKTLIGKYSLRTKKATFKRLYDLVLSNQSPMIDH